MTFFSEIKSVKAGLIFILILIIGIGVASYRNVLNSLEDVLAQIVTAEEGQRSFIITGDESYLEPYNKGLKSAKSDLSNLKSLLKDSKSQLNKLQQYDTLLVYRFNKLQLIFGKREILRVPQ